MGLSITGDKLKCIWWPAIYLVCLLLRYNINACVFCACMGYRYDNVVKHAKSVFIRNKIHLASAPQTLQKAENTCQRCCRWCTSAKQRGRSFAAGTGPVVASTATILSCTNSCHKTLDPMGFIHATLFRTRQQQNMFSTIGSLFMFPVLPDYTGHLRGKEFSVRNIWNVRNVRWRSVYLRSTECGVV